VADPEISRFPYKELACMSGSSTTPGCPSACVAALGHIAFRYTDSVGTRNQFSIAAQWLACTFPYRRFADILADACARLAFIDILGFSNNVRNSVQPSGQAAQLVGVLDRIAQLWYNDTCYRVDSRQLFGKIVVGF
jgi:hypothetical protein